MSRAGGADRNARRVLTLLAGNAEILTVLGVTALAFDLVALQCKQETGAAFRQLVGLVAGDTAVTAADALVLVEDHAIVGLTGSCLLTRAASAEGHQHERANTGTSEKFSPVDHFAHNVLHERTFGNLESVS